MRAGAGPSRFSLLIRIDRAASWNQPDRLRPGSEGEHDETSAQTISASGSRYCGAPGSLARRNSPSLPLATGALDRWVSGVVNAPPDGYTLLLVGATNAINATLYEKLNFNFIRDIAPVCGIIRVPLIMEVHPSVPVKTVAEFIAYAKAHPGKINMGSGGIGTTLHVSGELFKMMTGADMLHVPYRGAGSMLTDLLGGQDQFLINPLTGLNFFKRRMGLALN